MSVVYELWDVESGNRLERFDSESAALRAARELLELNGDDLVEVLMLGAFRRDETGVVERLPVLGGDALLARIRSLDPVLQSVAPTAVKQARRPREVTLLDRGADGRFRPRAIRTEPPRSKR